MRAIVTAGGTREPLDDVRFLSNQSSGSLGLALARALLARGWEVCLLAGPGVDLEGVGPGIATQRFSTAADLRDQLYRQLESPPALVLMAAAVADYSPVPAQGKIRSDVEERSLTLKRTPKILDGLRARCGDQTVLVGFKLLSGVEPEALIEVARGQNHRCALDLTFANELSEVHADRHAGWLVPAAGAAQRVEGDKAELAAAIVQTCLERVPGARGLRHQPGPPPRDPSFESAGILLRTARDMGIYPARGMFSHRTDDGGLWLPPREGAAIDSDDLVYTTRTAWRGPKAPSYKAVDHALLYAHLPEITALLEQTGGMVLADATTTGGTSAVLHTLSRRAMQGRPPAHGFAVRVDGRDLLGFPDVFQVLADWAEVREHALDAVRGLPEARVEPIFASSHLIGAQIRSAAMGRAVALWLQPAYRNHGYGEAIAARIAHLPVLVDSQSAPWFRARGWHGDGAHRHRLEPPTTAPQPQRGVSVCLVQPLTRKVLMGARSSGPWPGAWAFPGGRQEPGEGALAAALRELREETGIDLPPTPPTRSFTVYAATADTHFELTCFVISTFRNATPTPSDEMNARWVSLEEALRIRGLAPGVRRILRAIQCAG